MDRQRKLLACVSCACAALVAVAHELARRAPDERADERLACGVLSPGDERALEREDASPTSFRSALAVAVSTPVAHAPIETPPIETAPSVELAPESAASARIPELAGLLVDPRASDERLREWYARASDEDLVRARFRLERLLELAKDREGALARLFAGEVDVAVVERELVHVASRLMQWPASTNALAEVATRPHDDGAVFAERYARRSAEDLAIASWRVSRALALVQAQAVELALACGDYAVVPRSTGWG